MSNASHRATPIPSVHHLSLGHRLLLSFSLGYWSPSFSVTVAQPPLVVATSACSVLRGHDVRLVEKGVGWLPRGRAVTLLISSSRLQYTLPPLVGRTLRSGHQRRAWSIVLRSGSHGSRRCRSRGRCGRIQGTVSRSTYVAMNQLNVLRVVHYISPGSSSCYVFCCYIMTAIPKKTLRSVSR